MRKISMLLTLVLVTMLSYTQNIAIIPQPAEIKINTGKFQMNTNTALVLKNGADQNAANFLNEYVKKYFGIKLKQVKTAKTNFIELTTLQSILPGKEEAYSLVVSPQKITITGETVSGTFYGIQSLIQLLPAFQQKSLNPQLIIPAVEITDYPRFAYRGMHLDVSRHFMPVDFIKKYIDYLALHKLNTFHWHLTDDQGWRIEIKKYPKLTEIGAWRNGTIIGRYPGTGNDNKKYGGFYTQQQIKEVVKYAADRYITVIPEIEMPGHGNAAIAGYPWLSCFPEVPSKSYYPKDCAWAGDSTGKQVLQTWGVSDDVFCAGRDKTFAFLQDVIDEILPLFPSKYIHVGGDECPKANWKICPDCQKRMKDNNLKNEHELQSYFIQRMEKYINSKGRTLIGWDEILEGGLAPNASVMSWRGEAGGIAAAKQKHDVIMTPTTYVYFDYSQTQNEDSVTIGGFIDLEKVYNYEPIPKELNADDAKYISGIQANVWTEYMTNPRKIEYMIFPRTAALCEVAWSPKSIGSSGEKKNPIAIGWSDFEKRLQVQFKRYDLWKTNYSKAYFDLKATVIPTKDNNGVIWKLQSKYSKDICEYCAIVTKEEFIYKKDTILYDTTMKLYKGDVSKVTSYIVTKQEKKAGEKGFRQSPHYNNNDTLDLVFINDSRTVSAWQAFHHAKGPAIVQPFHFNKATGKKITLTNSPSQNYPGDGAFTLVNGVQNEKGRGRSTEFLGFNGTDCEAVIDLGSSQTISSVIVHSFRQKGAWIWRPLTVEAFGSADGQSFITLGLTDDFTEIKDGNGTMKVSFNSTTAKFIKVVVKNWGEIPDGEPGASNKPWLFVDEIEVNAPNP